MYRVLDKKNYSIRDVSSSEIADLQSTITSLL